MCHNNDNLVSQMTIKYSPPVETAEEPSPEAGGDDTEPAPPPPFAVVQKIEWTQMYTKVSHDGRCIYTAKLPCLSTLLAYPIQDTLAPAPAAARISCAIMKFIT